jgi:hypothetical protein
MTEGGTPKLLCNICLLDVLEISELEGGTAFTKENLTLN